MTKNKIKTIVMVVALILVVALAAGWIAQTVISKQGTENEPDKTAVFTVTPQNGADEMRLMSQRYSLEEATAAAEIYTITAETQYYSGDITWSLAWTGEEVYWNSSEKTADASDCIKLTVIDERSVQVECLQPFGRQIAVTAAMADKPSVTAECVCDYKQTYELEEIRIGFNSFRRDGSLGYASVNGIVPIPIELYGEQTLTYSCTTVSSSYTKVGTELSSLSDVSFSLTPNAEVIEAYGLEKYSFASYAGNFENALSGTIEGFFDEVWGAYAVEGTDYTTDDFAVDLCSAVNSAGFGIDSDNLYTLTIYGLPEAAGAVSYGYQVDLYNLIQYIDGLVSLSLNKSNITFGG